MKFEWDEIKRQRNLVLHEVDFADAGKLDWDAALSIDQDRSGELRHLTYAPIGNRLFALVWTNRSGRIRVISFRKANSREVDLYEKALQANP